MRKTILALLALILWSPLSFSQILEPVKWSFTFAQKGNIVDVTATATIDEGWKIYGTNIADGGPTKTSFGLDEEKGFELVGAPVEVTKSTHEMDPIFEMEISFFKHKAVLKQSYKITGKETKLQGYVEAQACDNQQCLPPTPIAFTYDVAPVTKATTAEKKTTPPAATPVKPKTKPTADTASHTTTPAVAVSPTKQEEQPNTNTTSTATSQVPSGALPVWHTSPKETTVVFSTASDDTRNKGLWTTFLLAFLGGLAALLTPCVFPMIPFTVSFFTKQSKTRAEGIKNAITYGLCIIIIYVLLGTGIVAVFGADSLNALSTNAWFNFIFFLILVVFAASFLGAFELTLPSSWVNASDKGVDKGGFLGIFFMAFTLALVSFSCTGPIVGTLLVASASSGSWLAPAIGMLGFSLALAIPFALFAAFPGWMNSLPKSGGWMNSVKVVLAFVELGMALKFLSIADMVLDLHLLHRELFIAIWIVIALLMGLYLFGLLRFPHDSPKSKPGIVGILLGGLSLLFAGYMIPGLWGAPVSLISGFPPPSDYAESPFGLGGNTMTMSTIAVAIICIIIAGLLIYNLFTLKFIGNKESKSAPISVTKTFLSIITLSIFIYILPVFSGAPIKIVSWAIPGLNVIANNKAVLPEHMHYGPQGIPVFDNYEEALAYAKKVDKPLFLDFTGVGCVNCRKVEDNVWSHKEIKEILTRDYIVVSLYVDIKEELPKDQQYTSPRSSKKIKTIGNKWSDFQATRFKANSQPYYVIVDSDRNYVGTVKTMDLDVARYKTWLLNNLQAYKNRK